MTTRFSTNVTEHVSKEATMRLALNAASRAGLAGEPPIGAALVSGKKVISVAANSVISSLDATAHAEINVIRDACQKENSFDLSGCHLFTTVEPCPMCYSACCYAGINSITFGASLSDLDTITNTEYQLDYKHNFSNGPLLEGGCLHRESLSLLKNWQESMRK